MLNPKGMKTVNRLLMFFLNLPAVLFMLCLEGTCNQSDDINNIPAGVSSRLKVDI